MDRLLGMLEKSSWIVVLPAGQESASLLKLYRKLGAGNICTVCDNSPAVQGRSVEGIDVISVECAVRVHPDAHFVIANKCHAQELYGQLIQLGVVSEQIYVCGEKIYTWKEITKFLLTR